VVDKTAGPVDDMSGTRLGAVLVLRDATERLAQEAQLRASEERFRSAFDHAPLGMALVSLAGEFIQVNDALCRLLGTTAEELKRHRQLELTLDADAAHELARLHELMLAPGGVVQFERRYRRLDGRAPVWTLVSVSLMHDADQPTCHLYQVHDLTEQKAAAEQLAELAEERMRRRASEMASSAKSEFLSRVSHEMRTPLNAVIGFAQLLQLPQAAQDGKSLAYAQHIRTAGEHMLALVTDLLDLNRAAQGSLLLSPQSLLVAGVVDECLHLLENLGHSHGIGLRAEVPAGLMVRADPTRLRQVLINLGSNAIKYNREGGSVLLRAQSLGAERVRLAVEDSGIGMTPEQLERLFQPFDRLGRERSKIPGIGLGLVIARGLVLEMGGTLAVTSQPRAGTTITIELPGIG
jgi:PAS domain S-box-containing protein